MFENNFNNQPSGEQPTPPQTSPQSQEGSLPVGVLPYLPALQDHFAKKEVRRLALIIGIPLLCLTAIGALWAFAYLFFAMKVFGMSYDDAINLSQNPAVQQIMQIIISTLMFLVPFSIAAKCAGLRIDKTIQFGAAKKGTALPFLLFGVGFCSFANIAMSYSSRIFDGLGIDYDVNFGDNPEGVFGFLLTFIATAIVPALVEEFACRGIVLGLLKKQGESFAIITSSIVFGIMHGNFEQIPFAVMVGLILGYIYVKTESIWICVLVHGINNAVSVIFSYLENIASVNVQNVLYVAYLVITLLAAIFGVLLLAKNKTEDFTIKKEKTPHTEKQKYTWFFTSWAIILFIVFNAIEAFSFFVI